MSKGGFSADLAAFAAKSTMGLAEARRAVAMTLFRGVIEATPVLTGRAKGNWQTSVSSPLLGVLPIRPAEAAIAEAEAATKKVEGDDPIIMRNNLPYIYRIEYEGWSHEKRPEGMVRVTVAQVTANIRSIIRKGAL